MNVTINGYVSFICNSCNKPHTVESQAFTFKEDTSPESENDEYIRYISQVDMPCASCSNKALISFDIWEYPEAVVNYSYYSVEGANDIECEFTIEHYFDDEVAKKEDAQYEPEIESENKSENDLDEEERYNETSKVDVYTDQYDDDANECRCWRILERNAICIK